MTAGALISSSRIKALNIFNGATDCYCREATMGEGQMTGLRRTIFLGLVALSVVWPHSSLRADQAFQRFLPLLVDLDGWQGKKPDGMSMEMPNMSMTSATRDYRRGPAQVHASVMIGQAAAGTLAPFQAGMNIQTGDGHMLTSTMHGFQVIKTFNTQQKSGAVLVALGKEALFSFSYNGITEDEALPLAEKFDWKAIQAAAQTK
jgi:hypothetical protein